MNVPTRYARSILALAACIATLAPFAAQAQFDAGPARPEAGSYPLWSLQYEAKNFAVISAETGTRGAVTCTDMSIMGNVGSSGGRSAVVQTRCSVSGHVVAPVSATVLSQFSSEYDSIAKRTCEHTLAGTLAGRILTPGVYCFPASAAVTGTLTLDGSSTGIWIIKVNGNLTGKSFSIVMAAGGKPCNVYLEALGAETMTTSNAKGNLLAGQAITMTNGSFVGRAFAKKAVTMTGVAVTGCQ